MQYKQEILGKRNNATSPQFHLLLPAISAIITPMMAQKTYKKSLCLFYILTLLLWCICSGASSVSEITDVVCGEQNCYVNHSFAIISTSRHLPAQKYLSARDSGTSETLSSARNRGIRSLSRTIRQVVSHLFSGNSSAAQHALSGLLLVREIPAHSSCGIIITNYVHRQDGQK